MKSDWHPSASSKLANVDVGAIMLTMSCQLLSEIMLKLGISSRERGREKMNPIKLLRPEGHVANSNGPTYTKLRKNKSQQMNIPYQESCAMNLKFNSVTCTLAFPLHKKLRRYKRWKQIEAAEEGARVME